MVFHDPQFSHGIAMVLRGESLRAGCYVDHGPSLGVLREKIVRRIIRDETPTRFEVETGFIRNHQQGSTSRQCDLLIHDTFSVAPLYRWEDFVVVHASQAKAVVEVKSDLDSEDFESLLKIHRSVVGVTGCGLNCSTFGYGLTGVTFKSFVNYIQRAATENLLEAEDNQRHMNWPTCIAVQDRQYMGFRPLRNSSLNQPLCYYVIDFSQAIDEGVCNEGVETGQFIDVFTSVLQKPGDALSELPIQRWFNSLPIGPSGKIRVTGHGEAIEGNFDI